MERANTLGSEIDSGMSTFDSAFYRNGATRRSGGVAHAIRTQILDSRAIAHWKKKSGTAISELR